MEYEIVWEIFNQCPNNQMRDVFIEERYVEHTDAYVEKKYAGQEISSEKIILSDGTVIYDIVAAGIRERITFTPV